MLRAFFNLVKRWQLNDRQGRILLGEPATRTYARWKAGDVDQSRISRDIRERLSILMGIHKSLRYMFPRSSRAYDWLHKPNQAFGGGSALGRLLAGSISDLVAVRAYLDAERGGW
ncbi:MAG: MbcA/ParS/Xre antitoxin family protein [Candidatus Poribacteria bacterium]|nr:MbcA/ParS/Xre antitoxin family protein [Candidatus Poribacteria bacterium]